MSRHEDKNNAKIDPAGKDDVKMFLAESKRILFLNPLLGITENEQLKEFYVFAMECQQPMGTIFCSLHDNCR